MEVVNLCYWLIIWYVSWWICRVAQYIFGSVRDVWWLVLVEGGAGSPTSISLRVFCRLSSLVPSHHFVRDNAALYRENSSWLWIWQFVIFVVYLSYALALSRILDFVLDWNHGRSPASFIVNCARFALQQFWNADEPVICPLSLLRNSGREKCRRIATRLLALFPARDEPIRFRRILRVTCIKSWFLLLLYCEFGLVGLSYVGIQVYVQYFLINFVVLNALSFIFVIGGPKRYFVFRCDEFCLNLSLLRWARSLSCRLILRFVAVIHIWIWNLCSEKVHVFIYYWQFKLIL